MGNPWDRFFTNERVPQETKKKQVTCMIWHRQLRLIGPIGWFPDSGLVSRVIYERISPACWKRTLRETTRDLVEENRWSLPGTGTDRKGACMAHLLRRPPRLAPSPSHRDTLLRCVLPLVVNLCLKVVVNCRRKKTEFSVKGTLIMIFKGNLGFTAKSKSYSSLYHGFLRGWLVNENGFYIINHAFK